MEYRCVRLDPGPLGSEIVIALLAEAGFDSFEEKDPELLAYVPESEFDPSKLDEICAELGSSILSSEVMPHVNWNSEWEKNYDPVRIWPLCLIRAPFHTPEEGYELELVIEPKMSFGTGHHATTELMIRQMHEMDLKGASVLDMGSGTGVLAIYAMKRGATSAVAIDIDEWAFENAKENCSRNGEPGIQVFQGDGMLLDNFPAYHVFLANINRNVLLEDMRVYKKHILPGGYLVLSGFYYDDLEVLLSEAEMLGMELKHTSTLNHWTCVLLKNKE